MRLHLPESQRVRSKGLHETALSSAAHLILIALAFTTAGGIGVASVERPREVALLFRTPAAPPTPRPARPSTAPSVSSAPTTVEIPSITAELPPLTSVAIPNTIPALEAHLGFPSELRRPAPTTGTPVSGAPISEALSQSAVDVPIVPAANNPPPTYPPALSAAGIEGSVSVQFVVDTLGRIEPASINILHADHAFFERSVRDVLRRMRFSPAQFRGARVRQLAEQSFSFTIRR